MCVSVTMASLSLSLSFSLYSQALGSKIVVYAYYAERQQRLRESNSKVGKWIVDDLSFLKG